MSHVVDVTAANAEALFPNGGEGGHMRSLAGRLATSTPRAADYIHQAPVLVLAVAAAVPNINDRVLRSHAIGAFAHRVKAGPKLRVLLNEYGVAPPFRMLRGRALSEANWPFVEALSKSDISTSALAQAIPVVRQTAWFAGLSTWHMAIRRRSMRMCDPNAGLTWIAALPIEDIPSRNAVHDVADFYAADPTAFNPRWTFAQAQAAMHRWHERLAADEAGRRFGHIGVGYTDRLCPESPLPGYVAIGPYTFVALETCEALFDEGRAMRHCVASYAAFVRAGSCAIYSIRNADNRRVATLELRAAGGRYHAVQLRGPCNAPVSMPISNAVHPFLRFVHMRLFADERQVGASIPAALRPECLC